MLRTVVVDSDPEGCAALRRLLSVNPGVVVVGEFARLAESLREIAGRRPDLVIAEIPYDPAAGDPRRAAQAVEALMRAVPEAGIVVTGPTVSAEFVIQVIRAGALEFLKRPVEQDEVLAALEKVLRLRRSAAPPKRTGQITSVFSTKGGLGVTTMAVNLAVCLAEPSPGNVLLMDLDTRQSDIATHLNLRPTYSVLDAVENLDRLDESFLRGLLVRHPSGLMVLPGPTRMERVQLGGEQVRAGLEIARSHFSHVVLDLRHDLDTGTIAALEASDTILFLTSLDVCALRSAAAGLAAFRQLGLNLQKVRLIVMREDTAEDVTLKHARDSLGVAIGWKTPSEYPTVVASVNSGEPVVLRAPRSRIAKNLRQLVATLSPAASVPAGSALRSAASLARLVWTPKPSSGE
jgi:pilus assembly protein CpaE